MQSPQISTDVIVVGGGLSGLTAACYLARSGARVTLFEKAAEPGGRASTLEYESYHFNRGIHALYSGGAAEHTLQELNIPYTGHTPKGVYALREGRLHPLPTDPFSLLRTSLLSAAEKVELLQIFMRLPGLNAHEFANVSVQDWIERTIHHPAVRQFFVANACTAVYTSALDLVSAEVFINKTQLFFKHPVLYIDGGWKTFVDGLSYAAETAGANIETNARVEAVECQNGNAVGVKLHDGTVMRASAVVIATNPQDAVKLVDQAAFPALRRIVDGLIPAQLACLDVALKSLPDPHHPVVQDIEKPRFMSVQSLFSRVAPEGGAIIYSFKQLDPQHPSDSHEDERELEALLDTVQPGWRDVLVKRYFLPRIDAVGMLPTPQGGGFAGRPDPRAADIGGLYLAGDWVGSEGFLADACMASARQAAHWILQHELQMSPHMPAH